MDRVTSSAVTDVPTAASDAASVTTRKSRVPWPVIRGTAKVMGVLFVVYFFGPTLITGFRTAIHELSTVNPLLLAVGFVFEMAALLCYSLLTRAALPKNSISLPRLVRIQLSTKALSSIMPGGSAAGSALGYRLLTLSGVSGPDAGFALATVGLGSAVVLNLILMLGLIVSIPLRGVNPFYGTAAAVGVVMITLAALIAWGLIKGQARAERITRWFAKKIRIDPDRAIDVVRHLGERVRELLTDRSLLFRVVGWAAANWLLDAASLWIFLRAFGGTTPIDGLIIAFGLANVLAAIPITPGGVGIVEGVMIPTLVGFGLSKNVATLGVVSYRAASYWLPILLGGISYFSLRIGPWSIENRDEVKRLRDVAKEEREDDTSGIEWAQRYGSRGPATGEIDAPGDGAGEGAGQVATVAPPAPPTTAPTEGDEDPPPDPPVGSAG
jgi:uncharacterized protein (TIRG00374 family)